MMFNPLSILKPSEILHEIVPNVAAGQVIKAIANRDDIAIVKTKPMMRSVEGWTAVVGAGTVIVNAIGPVLGLQVNGQIAGAVEVVGTAIGLPAGYGTAAVYLVVGISFAVIWVRKKWFTHTITPAAAVLAAETGKVV